MDDTWEEEDVMMFSVPEEVSVLVQTSATLSGPITEGCEGTQGVRGIPACILPETVP